MPKRSKEMRSMITNPWLLHRRMFATHETEPRNGHLTVPARPHRRHPTLRVAHVLRKFNPDEWGGTETAVQRLFDGLSEHEIQNVMYCPRLENGPAQEPFAKNSAIV